MKAEGITDTTGAGRSEQVRGCCRRMSDIVHFLIPVRALLVAYVVCSAARTHS